MNSWVLLRSFVVSVILSVSSTAFAADAKSRPVDRHLTDTEKSRGLAIAKFDPAAMAGQSEMVVGSVPKRAIWTSGDFRTQEISWVRLYVQIKTAASAGRVAARVTDVSTGESLYSQTIEFAGALDREVAFPMINSEAFKAEIAVTSDKPLEPVRIEIREILVLRSPDPERQPQITLGNSAGSLAYATDQKKIDMFTTHAALRQSGTKKSAWENPKKLFNPPLPDYLEKETRAVVRLSRKAPSCAVRGLEAAQVPLVDRGTIGCTAFRVGKRLFATAWHCMSSDRRGGCGGSNIDIGYDLTSDSHAAAVQTRAASEKCEAIVYENRRIDLTIFQVTDENWQAWSEYPVLEFVDGNRVPFTGEELAIIHYPSFTDTCGVGAAKDDVQGDFQLGLRISRYAAGRRSGDECHVLGQADETKGRKYLLEPPRDPRDMCDEGGAFGRRVAFGHRCATCEGSSGSPVISMSTDADRQGKVVGVHVNGMRAEDAQNFPNRAVRSTVIADCLDTAALFKNSQIKAAEGASSYEYCQCDHNDHCLGGAGGQAGQTR